MARRQKQSISMFLVSALGLMAGIKAFLWVLETQYFKLKVDVPYLNVAIVTAIVLLAVRITWVLWRAKAKKKVLQEEAATIEEITTSQADTYHCARCGKGVSEKVRNYCLGRPEQFQNRVYCYEHQR
ncbi:hypothetical protein [Paenibacillus sp. GCM10012303]|uniref:hypothetical protein n=1 Tax=Paenibacillus sp. GCM10012303 TaxID=3317340 RepID=UPI00360EB5AF